MVVNIYLKEKDGDRSITIPILPEKIKYKSGAAAFVSFISMKLGEVIFPSGAGLCEFAWESEFPGAGRKTDPMIQGTWQEPKTYHNILEDWKKKGTIINLIVSNYPFNKDMYITDYNAELSGPFGDIAYEISFKEYKKITINTTKVETESEKEKTKKRTTKQSSTYVVKQGDTLWSIAIRYYRDASKWTHIYRTNKTIIDRTAKLRWSAAGVQRGSEGGHWIFPGTILTIPDLN